MPHTSRPYREPDDITRLTEFLAACRDDISRAHYLHTGDLVWQVFHMLADYQPAELLQLWEDHDGKLLGFVLVYPPFGFFEVQLHPGLRGTVLEDEMLTWVETYFHARRQGTSESSLFTLVHERDIQRSTRLELAGYERGEPWLYLQRTLSEQLPAPVLPDGFTVRPISGASEAAGRAGVLAAVFDAPVQTERYRQFMHAPGYVRDLDIVVVAPDGQFAAFAMCWVDTRNKVGQFEPVGTAPEMRRRGLGAAVLGEGLRRMQSHGAQDAIVVVEAAAEMAVDLYRSVGFTHKWNLYLYEKH